jgi:4-hydroxy-tetrahydrodipicolinate reductase
MADKRIRIGVAGALGRMGRVVETLARAESAMIVAARIDRPGAAPDTGAPPLLRAADALALCDVIVDVSTPSASATLATLAAANGGPALVIGSTGFSADEEAQIAAAARRIAIVKSGNFSLGVNLLALLVEEAARRLGAEAWDIEILETHHRRKADAPSGTALLLGDAAARGRGVTLGESRLPARSGVAGERPRGGIGFASLRGGGVVGDHEVMFAAEDEVITLSHSAKDRSLFAHGALAAARWAICADAGLHDMRDVLGAADRRP